MTRSQTPAFLVVAVLATAAHPGSAWAADPLTDGRKAFAAGQWNKAEKRLRKALGGPTRDEARLLLADLLLLRGRAQEAANLASKAFQRHSTASPGAAIVGRAQLRLGHPKEAVEVLRQALKGDPEAHDVKVVLARALIDTGKPKVARALLEPMLKADDRGAFRNATDLTALGRAARLLGRTRFAFQSLDDAASQDPKSPDPLVELGLTALDVHDTITAEKAFLQALNLRPEDPRALIGLARVELEIARTYDDALSLLDRAQAVDPGLPAAERLRAEIDIFGERPDAALERLDKLLATRGRDLQALSLVASAQDALGDTKAFERTIRRIHKVRRGYAPVFTTAARFAERQNRYKRAIALAKRALKTDPDHWRAHAILGVQYTRSGVPGDEARGRRHLERYYERDDYDSRVTNLLNLYERWIGEYVWIDDPDVRIRVHKDEAEIARRVILPFARQMMARYDARYPYSPPRPVTLELFHKPNLFALRSIGMPAVASHGLCFGRLVTARSPSSGDFNWGMVVAHELAHIYGLGLSDHRVPRWFTEGMAEYETNVLRPEWTRHHGQALYNALKAGRIPGVLDLSKAFTQARDLGEVVVAYQQSSLVIHHLVQTVGYKPVAQAHKRFAKGERLASVIKGLTGLAPAEFDRRFSEWLRQRTAHYKDNWDLDKGLYRDPVPLRAAVQEAPNDADARAKLAAHFLVSGAAGNALIHARRALKSKPRHPLASFVAGSALGAGKGQAEEELNEARAHLEAMIEDGHDGYVVRRALVDVALSASDPEGAEAHMRGALLLDPQKTLPHSGLARLLTKMGRDTEVPKHLERWAMLNMNSPEPAGRLALLASERGDTEETLRWAEHLGFITPYRPASHLLKAAAYTLLNKNEQAWDAYETAVASDPKNIEAKMSAARAALRLGKTDDARRLAKQALALKKGAPEALKLLKEIDSPR